MPILVKSTSTPKGNLLYLNYHLTLSHSVSHSLQTRGMTMKIPINLLKTCPINSEIYRDSDVGDLVNSIGEVGLLQQSRWCKTSGQCWRIVCRFFTNKIHIHYPPSKIPRHLYNSPESWYILGSPNTQTIVFYFWYWGKDEKCFIHFPNLLF